MARSSSTNISELLLQREVGGLRGRNLTVGQTPSETRKALGSWTEHDFMQHCSGQYVEFKPVPRSTIAASFSPNGCLLASTHGDHTVKIVDCFSGTFKKVLEGHTRTPWVVRFHPIDSDILASGSLDHRVVIWRISTSEKLYAHDFGKPIASIAFHPSGKALVVASGHKVYFWDYMKTASSARPNPNPSHILRTKRSLRALHFHPLGLPLILTAEVVDSKKPTAQSAVTGAAQSAADGTAGPSHPVPVQLQQQQQAVPSRLQMMPPLPGAGGNGGGTGHLGFLGNALSDVAMRVLDMAGMRLPQAVARVLMHQTRPGLSPTPDAGLVPPLTPRDNGMWPVPHRSGFVGMTSQADALDSMQRQRQAAALRGVGPRAGHMASLEDLPAQGASNHPRQIPGMQPLAGPSANDPRAAGSEPATSAEPGQMAVVAAAAAAAVTAMERLRLGPEAGNGPSTSSSLTSPTVDMAMCDPWGMQRIHSVGGVETHAFPLEPQPLNSTYDLSWGWEASGPSRQGGADGANSAAAQLRHNAMLESQLMPLATTSEQPCIVNLNVWSFNLRRPSNTLDRPRISVPRAVLCSEMGAVFSPCGRYLALCVAVDEPSEAGRVWLAEHIRLNQQRMAVAEAIRDSATGRYGPGTAATSTSATATASSSSPWWANTTPPSEQQPSVGPSSSSEPPSTPVAWSFTPTEFRETEYGFTVAMAETWEVFPHDVPWLEFPRGTPMEAVHKAVTKAREAAHLNKPLYELRIYSLDGRSFGQVLQARLIRAAHCLTSVQFSPTSEHLLVAYGRRFISLCNLIAEGRSLVPAHTIVEVYSTKNLQLVRVLPSLDDEVNVAAFHPVPGAGLVYGTKEGRLRMLRYDRRTPRRTCIPLAANGGRMDAELAAAERDDSNSEEETEAGPVTQNGTRR